MSVNSVELRVLVVADDPLVRSELTGRLAGWPECHVAGQASENADPRGELEASRANVVLWDLGWDPRPSLDTSLERMADLQGAGAPIVALLPDGRYSAEVWAAGARGLLPRDVDGLATVAALQAVVQGLVVLDPALAESMLPSREREPGPLIEPLTPREMEVLRLLADGLTNRGIAQRLGISENTVKYHVTAVLGKLGTQNRAEAIVRAARSGLLVL